MSQDTYNSLDFVFGQHRLAPVIGDSFLQQTSGSSFELTNLLHQIIPVWSLGRLLLQLLQLFTF